MYMRTYMYVPTARCLFGARDNCSDGYSTSNLIQRSECNFRKEVKLEPYFYYNYGLVTMYSNFDTFQSADLLQSKTEHKHKLNIKHLK